MKIARSFLCLVLTSATAYGEQANPERNAYFGETHVHTSWSMDAWLMGNHLTGPADAYVRTDHVPLKPTEAAGLSDWRERVAGR
jgi:hypothetical protein